MHHLYKCVDCAKTYPIKPEVYVCPDCQKNQKENEPLRGILEVDFNQKLSNQFDVFDFLPVDRKYFPKIPVGNTPLWEPENLRTSTGLKNLFIKDDSSNPTGSFKDRASFLVAAFARENKIKDIVLASTGNAGSSMSGVGAASGLNITLFLPKTAPQAKMIQALQYGARLILVDGNYDKAYDLSMEYSKTKGGMSRNTAYNPLTIEGKKTVSLEIYKQLGNIVPDYVFVPVGDGVIISGVYKGFKDLVKAGLAEKIPVIYSAQSSGSDAINRAFVKGAFENIPTSTVADSICVDVPRNGFHALKNLKEYKGRIVTITDEEILIAQKELSSTTGLFSEPAGATSYAGFKKAFKNNELEIDACIVVLTTGSGLKDTQSALRGITVPAKAIKNLNEIV